MVRWLVLLAVLVLCLGAGNKRIVVVRGQQFPSTLAIVVDNSGSMGGKPYDIAVGYAIWVAEQAGDEARVRFCVFGHDMKWERAEWTRLPDKNALDKSKQWLIDQGTGGQTYMASCLEIVLQLPESPLGVIVITDEDPTDSIDDTCERIVFANKSRKEQATIGVIGVNPEGLDREKIGVILSTQSGGTYMKIVEKR